MRVYRLMDLESLEREDAAALIDDLRRQVEHHRFAYYVLDRPEISDADFDRLYRQLQDLEGKFPDLIVPGSPTQKVGAPPSTEFAQVKHRVPMLSLANAMSYEDLDRWGERLGRGLSLSPEEVERLRFVCELKIDGLSIALTYRQGRFVEGATRGNGEVGEDVTLNLKTIANLPAVLKVGHGLAPPALFEVRGEVYMPISSFSELNQALESEGQQPFANPRNAASGSLRQKDPRITARRKLSAWIYFAYVSDEYWKETLTHASALELLRDLGFPVNPHYTVATGLAQVKEFCRNWFEKRHGLDYQTDGVVVKLDDRSLWDVLGTTAHSPRWAIAFKYPPDEEETLVEGLEFDVGRTGAVTPVACLKPVILAGTTVRRATLHNFEQIARLDVRVGDTVVVRKAGEIIPEVLKVVVEKRPPDLEPVRQPLSCPECGYSLERAGAEVVLRCPNFACPAQKQRRLEHWVSRDAMDIDGLGTVLLAALNKSGLVKDPSDLYALKADDLTALSLGLTTKGKSRHMSPDVAAKLLKKIADSRARGLGNIIFALGIRHVGAQTADLLASHFSSLAELAQARGGDLDCLEGVGPATAEAVQEYFSHAEHIRLIERLAELGVKLEAEGPPKEPVPQALSGKTLVVTGTLATMERADAEKLIKARGGKASSSVSKKTDYLVVGANPGSKLDRARELGITVLDEAQFKDLLAGGS